MQATQRKTEDMTMAPTPQAATPERVVTLVEVGGEAAPTARTTAPRQPVVPALPQAEPVAARRSRLPGITPRSLLTLALAVISLGSLVLFWYLAVKYRVDFYVRFNNIPSPQSVLQDASSLLGSPRFQRHIAISLRRIVFGFAIAAVFGVWLGILLGRYRMLRELVFPAMEVMRPIPAIAWVPISIMLWPTSEASIVFITFLGSFFPILLNTMHGVEAIDKVLVRAARSLGANEVALFWHVVLPGALPQVFTGLTLGMGVAWVSLIAAEMISGQFGIGYFTWEAYSLVQYSEIVLGMIVIGVLGLACSGVIRLAGNALMPWAARQSQEMN